MRFDEGDAGLAQRGELPGEDRDVRAVDALEVTGDVDLGREQASAFGPLCRRS
jgi:hypothetical protein